MVIESSVVSIVQPILVSSLASASMRSFSLTRSVCRPVRWDAPAEAAKLSYHSAVYTYELLDYCQYRVTIHVKSEAANQTHIRINPYYEGFYIEEGASKPIVLRSNGSLEQKIIDRLSQPAENLSSTR